MLAKPKGSNDTPGSNTNASPAAPSSFMSSAGGAMHAPTFRAASGPIQAVNMAVQVTIKTTGTPVMCPSILVPPGAAVTVEANNGTDGGNAKTIRIGRTRESVAGSGGTPLSPDSEKSWPSSPTVQLWVNGTAGDAAVVKVQRGV